MQQRRFRPGDVLDDYCPRERRITDHAIVAMIDDHIKQTRCVVCDAEHEYKEGKVPPQRRKRPTSALFTQVLDGLQAPQPAARVAAIADIDDQDNVNDELGQGAVVIPMPPPSRHAPAEPAHALQAGTSAAPGEPVAPPPTLALSDDTPTARTPDEGPVRRPLIRATLPRPEGQPIVTRAMPEFTIRQPNTGRPGHQRPGARRRGGHQGQGQGAPGPMRFGRGSGQGEGQGHGQRPQGQGPRAHGGRNHGGNNGRPGGPRRGGKKR
jgi:hypothetical protein